MPLIWAIACKLLGLQCSSFAKRCSYILSWEWLWSFGRPHSTAKVCQLSTPLSNKMIKICNSGYAQKSPYWDLTFLGIIMSIGHEKSCYTVVLTVMADGTKLPPMIIFKRNTKPPGNYENYDMNLYIIICVNEFIIYYTLFYSTCINI